MLRLLVIAGLSLAVSAQDAHQYKEGALLPLWANKVGPFANPSETYEYYTLPFCKPAEEVRKSLDLGGAIGGDRLMQTTFEIHFKSASSSHAETVVFLAPSACALSVIMRFTQPTGRRMLSARIRRHWKERHSSCFTRLSMRITTSSFSAVRFGTCLSHAGPPVGIRRRFGTAGGLAMIFAPSNRVGRGWGCAAASAQLAGMISVPANELRG